MGKVTVKLARTPIDAISESKRYFKNAKEYLKKSPIEYGLYKDEKYVKEACGIGYLAVLRAIDAYLLSNGTQIGKLPTSIQEYEKELRKVPHNGKLMASMRSVYDILHISGYYRGVINVEVIKEGFKHAREVIDTFTKILE